MQRIPLLYATFAVSRNIFYTMVKNQVEYDATLWAQRDLQREKRFQDKLQRQAPQFGYRLVSLEENPAAKPTDPKGSTMLFLKTR